MAKRTSKVTTLNKPALDKSKVLVIRYRDKLGTRVIG